MSVECLEWIPGSPPKDGEEYEVHAPPHSGMVKVRWASAGKQFAFYWEQTDGNGGLMIPISPIEWRGVPASDR